MKIYSLNKKSEFERMFPPTSPLQKPDESIFQLVNNTCQNDKECEKFYFKQIQKLIKQENLSLENVQNIQYQKTQIEIPKHLEDIVSQVKLINGKFVSWSIKQLEHIQPEDYGKLLEDLKIYNGLLINNKEFKKHDINTLKDENELYNLVKSFKNEVTIIHDRLNGKWIYQDDKVKIFESTDENTIAQLSQNTRWCIKDPNVAKNTYHCNNNPMQFVFIDDKIIAVIQLHSSQIKNVDDQPLNDYSIISIINPILKELKLIKYNGDFEKYNSVLDKGQKINNKISNADDKLGAIKEMLLPADYLVFIDSKYILFDKEIQNYVVDQIKKYIEQYDSTDTLPNFNSIIVTSIKELYNIYINFWSEKITKNLRNHLLCPGYLAKDMKIQNTFISSMIKTLQNFDNEDTRDKMYCMENIRKNPKIIPQEYFPLYKENKIIFYRELFADRLEIFNFDETYQDDPELLEVGLTSLENKLKKMPNYYPVVPRNIIKKYPERFLKYEEKYIFECEYSLRNNPTSYKYIKEDMKQKYSERLEKAHITGWINLLSISPENYDLLPEDLEKKYPEQIKQAHLKGIKQELIKDIKYYSKIPLEIRTKYAKFFQKTERIFMNELEHQLQLSPEYYSEIPPDLINKYLERMPQYEEAYIVGCENKLESFPFYYKSIPEQLQKKYADRLEKAFLSGVKYAIINDSDCYESIPKHIREKYKKEINEYLMLSYETLLRSNPKYYTSLPKEAYDQPERIQEAYIIGCINMIKKNRSFYYEIPINIRKKYDKRLKKALINSWKELLEDNFGLGVNFYQNLPDDLKRDYPEIFDKYKPTQATSWYKNFITSKTE